MCLEFSNGKVLPPYHCVLTRTSGYTTDKDATNSIVSERRTYRTRRYSCEYFYIESKYFTEHKDKVFLVVEHQSVIAREGWELKMDTGWGREAPLALAGVKSYC